MTVAQKKVWLEEFLERLREEGDMFWSMGSTSKDFELITSTGLRFPLIIIFWLLCWLGLIVMLVYNIFSFTNYYTAWS